MVTLDALADQCNDLFLTYLFSVYNDWGRELPQRSHMSATEETQKLELANFHLKVFATHRFTHHTTL